jgi:hypothetical protein
MFGYDKNGRTLNRRGPVYQKMYLEICMHYRSLPDPRTLTYDEIEFYYEGIRGLLKYETRPQ